MFDDGVVAHVAFDLGAAAFDQRAVLLEGFDQLQDAANIVHRCFAQFFQLFVHDHGADPVVHINLQQNRAVYRKRDDMAALYAVLASLDAVLQVKRSVSGLVGGRQLA